jgi:hypothetical protein
MRRGVLDSGPLSRGLYNVPNRFWRVAFTPGFTKPVYAQQNPALADPGGFGPLVDDALRPSRDRNGCEYASFANQIGDHPMFLPNVEVLDSQTDKFRAPASASGQQRHDGAVALAAQGLHGGLQKRSRLIDGPANFRFLRPVRAFDAPNARRQFRAQL